MTLYSLCLEYSVTNKISCWQVRLITRSWSSCTKYPGLCRTLAYGRSEGNGRAGAGRASLDSRHCFIYVADEWKIKEYNVNLPVHFYLCGLCVGRAYEPQGVWNTCFVCPGVFLVQTWLQTAGESSTWQYLTLGADSSGSLWQSRSPKYPRGLLKGTQALRTRPSGLCKFDSVISVKKQQASTCCNVSSQRGNW